MNNAWDKYEEVKNMSIDFGGEQYWIAWNKPSNQKEIIKTHAGYFYNFNDNIYKLSWENWVYSGPLDLERLSL